MNDQVLEAKGIVKDFPGVRAVDGVDLCVRRGEVHGLVGENGAGKSTLISILGGVYRPDEGEIYVEGTRVAFDSPLQAARAGIALVHQELSLVPALSVAENLFPNCQPVNRLGSIDTRQMYQQARAMLAMFQATDIDPATPVKHLQVAKQQIVEILKAMALHPKVLILDEPTSSLTNRERERLFANVSTLKASGTSVIFISHHLKEVFDICDQVTILKDGRRICDARVADIDEAFLIRNMVGREILDIYGYEQCCQDAPPLFVADRISRKGEFKDLSFSIRPGEIVGFYGLVGSGRTEVGRAIFGAEPIDAGDLYLDSRKIVVRSPTRAIGLGIGYLTEDRKLQGLYLSKSIRDNVISNHLGDFVFRGLLSNARTDDFARATVRDFSVATPGIEQTLSHLSGGNQQKVLLATWLGIKPRLLVADEPTKGVDIGARSEIYRFLRQLARQGASVMMISSDLLEVLGLSDRVVVMKEGRIAGELNRAEATEERVVALATGVRAVEPAAHVASGGATL